MALRGIDVWDRIEAFRPAMGRFAFSQVLAARRSGPLPRIALAQYRLRAIS